MLENGRLAALQWPLTVNEFIDFLRIYRYRRDSDSSQPVCFRLHASPRELVQNEVFQSFPVELFRVQMKDPLANFIGSPRKSFGVGLGDGSVRRVTDNFDVELFKALLTRAGGERIQPW